MSYLNKAKRNLAARATQLYNDMRGDINFNEYEDHYSSLGKTISDIDQTESWGELLQKIMKGNFDHIGMFTEDEDMLEEFLVEIFGK